MRASAGFAAKRGRARGEDGRPAGLLSVLGAIALLWSQSGLALGPGLVPDVEAVTSQLDTIVYCGRWSTKEDDGFVRVLLGVVSVSGNSELYVQWVSDRELPRRLVRTLTFPEINDDHAEWNLEPESLRCTVQGPVRRITIRGSNGHESPGHPGYEMIIRLEGDGRYRLDSRALTPARRPRPKP